MSENLTSLHPVHESDSFRYPETVIYDDQETAIRFSHEGDKIVWNMHKWADDPAMGLRGYPNVIIRTASGNAYAAGSGILYDKRTKGFWDLHDLGTPAGADITIGEPWHLAGVVSTTPVTGVELRYRNLRYNTHLNAADFKQAGENPFRKLDEIFARIEKIRK